MAKKTGPMVAETVDTLRREVAALRENLAAAEADIAALRAAADTDHLLGILNRRGFERELGRSLAYIARYGATGALVVLDLDRLKPINDRHGHAAGDAVLKATADTMQRQIRASDVVGRLGGDEFGLLLWNLSEADACLKAAALEDAIDALRFDFPTGAARVGASAGLVMLDRQSDGADAIMRADRAMYARKTERRRKPARPLRR